MEQVGMTRSKKIAVTGGIGSGKSTFADILRAKGCTVFSCDKIYRDLLGEESFLKGLAALFPDCVTGCVLDKVALSKLVFSNEAALRKLNVYAHPAIMTRLFSQMEAHTLSFAEVPLLFEGGYEDKFDCVIAVLRERNARINAVKLRNGLPEDEILARMAQQFDWDTPPKNCYIVRNDGSLEELEAKADEFLRFISYGGD